MAVYFIQAGESGPVKIGTADDVPTRIRELQCGNHLRLSVLRVIDGGQKAERWLHREFASLRMRGEWFDFSGRMMTVLPPVFDDAVETEAGHIIRAFGGASKVAEITGSTRTAVCNWRRDGIPAKHWITLIEAAAQAGIAGVTRETVAAKPRRMTEAA